MDKSPDWTKNWSAIRNFDALDPQSFFGRLLTSSLPNVAPGSKTAIEIGCFPGQFIDHVGGLGYVISGIDTYERVVDLNEVFKERNRLVGAFRQVAFEDFLSERPAFDVVISLGFIEHFLDWPRIVRGHAALCKPQATLIIGAPNFATPTQRALHRLVDADNIDHHVLSAMYPLLWSGYLTAIGFSVTHAGPAGSFSFWTETTLSADDPRLALQNLFNASPMTLASLGNKFHKRESAYGWLVATRQSSADLFGPGFEILESQFKEISELLSSRDELVANHFQSSLRELFAIPG